MTVRITKSEFNLREKLSELDKPYGLKGNQLLRSETSQEARDLISAGRKNKIINGAMMIDQRNAGASNTSSNGFHVDRFRTQVGGMDQLNQTYQQVNDGPDGFEKSLKIVTNTAESDIASTGEYLALYHKLEGQNLQDLEYGTDRAKSVTVSFYVKSSITGTFGFTVYRNDTSQRVINKSYEINYPNIWERKIITLEGDAGAIISNLQSDQWWTVWHLGASPGYMTTQEPIWGTYDGSNWAGFHEQNGVITTQNATWQITGVQLEVGRNATEFEHRNTSEELALCQRYCFRLGGLSRQYQLVGNGFIGQNGSTKCAKVQVALPTTMRASPDASVIGTDSFIGHTGGIVDDMVVTLTSNQGGIWNAASNGDHIWLDFGKASGGTPANGTACVVYTANNNQGEVLLEAEI